MNLCVEAGELLAKDGCRGRVDTGRKLGLGGTSYEKGQWKGITVIGDRLIHRKNRGVNWGRSSYSVFCGWEVRTKQKTSRA